MTLGQESTATEEKQADKQANAESRRHDGPP